jgi:23S rRNA pseudouridine1911/1915/1917 synthase
MKSQAPLNINIPMQYAGLRLDQALARLYPEYSRARLQLWIRQGHVRLDGTQPRPRLIVHGGEQVLIYPKMESQVAVKRESIPLNKVYEDAQLLVINKPPGLVVHPAAGNWQGTLLNAVLHYAPELERLPRGGIVHRLDKDTSGLIVIARTLQAHKSLVAQLHARRITREYLTLVQGRLVAGSTVTGNIGRHPVNRKRMAVIERGKPAVTHYRIERRFRAHTLLRVILETGRTHQIRVHLAYIQHPVVGDPVYGGRPKRPPQAGEALVNVLQCFKRQALHAVKIGLEHPQNGEFLFWQAPLPQDMQALVKALGDDLQGHEFSA